MASNGAIGGKIADTVNDYNPIIEEIAKKYGITLPIPHANDYSNKGPNLCLHSHAAFTDLFNVLAGVISNQQCDIESLQESVENIIRELRIFDHSPKKAVK